jgi:hypothetical protein
MSCGNTRIYLELEVRRVALPMLRQGEARTPRLSCRQSVLHEAVCLVRRTPLPQQHHQGCCRGTESALGQTVKELDKQYMQAQLERAGTPGPKAIGIDEISIRKGHTYRIVVSDLIRRPADLVRRRGSFGSQHERSSTTGWARRRRAASVWPSWTCGSRSAMPPQTSAPGRHSVRQVSRHAPSQRGARQGTEGRVRPAVGRGRGATSRARSTSC